MYDEIVQMLRNEECLPFTSLKIMKQAADAIEELSRDLDSMNEANIALYGALPKWIPVTERLPKMLDGENISKEVYVTDGTDIAQACIIRDYDGVTSWTYTGIGEITHWCEQIPLPQPPKEEKDADD